MKSDKLREFYNPIECCLSVPFPDMVGLCWHGFKRHSQNQRRILAALGSIVFHVPSESSAETYPNYSWL